MAALTNGRHERFAQELAKGKTADEAYQLAGFKANRGNATRLKANESVTARVAEIQARVSEKAEWTAADRLKMLSEIAVATKGDDPRVAVSAIAEANKMQGSHAPTKTDLSNSDGSLTPTVIQLVGVAAQDDSGKGPTPE